MNTKNITHISETQTINMLNLKIDLYATGDGFAIEMIEAMQKRATTDAIYADLLDDWLKCGSTIKVRELCEPFRDWSFLKTLGPLYPVPWFNCVDAIDSAWLHVFDTIVIYTPRTRTTS